MKTFKQLVDYSVRYKGPTKELDCNIELKVDGKTFNAYSVSVSNRDLLFYCDNCSITYLVDNISGNDLAVLHEIIED